MTKKTYTERLEYVEAIAFYVYKLLNQHYIFSKLPRKLQRAVNMLEKALSEVGEPNE